MEVGGGDDFPAPLASAVAPREPMRRKVIVLRNQQIADVLDLQAKQAYENVKLATVRILAKQSRLGAYPLNVTSGKYHVVTV